MHCAVYVNLEDSFVNSLPFLLLLPWKGMKKLFFLLISYTYLLLTKREQPLQGL